MGKAETIAGLKAAIAGLQAGRSNDEFNIVLSYGPESGLGGHGASQNRASDGPGLQDAFFDEANGKGDETNASSPKRRTDAFGKLVAYVNASDKSEKTIREKLERSEYAPEDIDEAVQRAKRCGFIDDARFAQVLIRSRISQCRGSAGIQRELAENGIDPESVPGWPYEFQIDYDSEFNRALEVLSRKPPRSKNLREGAYRRLMQKGYPASVASSAARAWCEGLERSS